MADPLKHASHVSYHAEFGRTTSNGVGVSRGYPWEVDVPDVRI